MFQHDIRYLADELQRDVADVKLASAADVRRRGDARHARTMAIGALAVIAATGAGAVGTVQYVGHLGQNPAVVGSSVGVRVAVFYADTATPAQRAKVEAELRTFRLIGDVLFETREEAYARFKEQFRDAPDLVESTKPESLPQSERLILADPADFDELKRRIEALPGISEVVNSSALGFPGADPIPPR
jgi:cell division protein FtsX